MTELERLIKTVAEGLKSMAQGVEKLAEKVEAIGKSVPEKKAKGKAKAKHKHKAPAKPKKAAANKATKKAVPKKEKQVTASDTVLDFINKSKNGVDTAAIVEKTGYDRKKVANLVFRLRKQGKVKSVGRGVYWGV